MHQGGVTYVQVKRLVAAPAALPARPPGTVAPAPPRPTGAAPLRRRPGPADAGQMRHEQGRPMADVGAFLDEAFGRERS